MSVSARTEAGASQAARLDLSVVVPIFNEEETIGCFLDRLEPVLDTISPHYEIIFVDDGSRDSSFAQLIRHRVRNPRIKVLSLSRNFGKDVALSAGLDYASGDAVVPIDCDLQDPPELIVEMYARKCEGYDIVAAKRANRDSDSYFKRMSARAFYRIHNSMSDVDILTDTGDFRLLDRKVIDALRLMPERNRFMKGMFTWVGFKQTYVEYKRDPRVAGVTKWKYWKLWNFALDGIVASSTLPLRIWTYLGVIIALGAFLYSGALILNTWINGIDVPGYASLMTVVLFLGGINIVATGILGEYLGRVYLEVQRRPLYIVQEAHGLKPLTRTGTEWNETSIAGSTTYKTVTGGSARVAKSFARY